MSTISILAGTSLHTLTLWSSGTSIPTSTLADTPGSSIAAVPPRPTTTFASCALITQESLIRKGKLD